MPAFRFGLALLVLASSGCESPRSVGPACGVRVFERRVFGTHLQPLDVLFVVDATPSIAPHLARLRAALPAFFAKLVDAADPADDWGAYRNLHVGVISSDLGADGSAADGCSAQGDAGLLRGGATCGETFAWYYDGYHDQAQTLSSIDCALAQVSGSCELTQPLEAALKALSPSAPGTEFLVTELHGGGGLLGHGDGENAGFYRSGLSSLLVVIVTDRDDGSSAPLERYIDGFRSLQPDRPVMFLLLAGVPPDLVRQDQPVDFDDEGMRNAFYDDLLADPRLQLRAAAPVAPGQPALVPSCALGTTPAYPPRRLLEYLRESKQSRLRIASLCDEDLASSLYAALQPDFGEIFGPCLPSSLPRDAAGLVPCRMTWELPATRDPAWPLTITTCAERADLLSVPSAESERRSARGRVLCDVRQLPVPDGALAPAADAGPGFYFDHGPNRTCFKLQTRIAYTRGAKPPENVRVELHCTDRTQHVLNPPRVIGAELGDPCDPGVGSQCSASKSNGDPLDRFCHPDKHVCVGGCQTDADCPTGWLCDSPSAGRPICINPSCESD